MELYFGRMSGNSSRAVFGLCEARVAWERRLVDTRTGENKTPEYLAVNPMGKVPTLVDGALRLWESNAINWYVAERHPEAGLLPTTIEGRASVLRWLSFQTGHVTPACVAVFRASHPDVQAFWGVTGDRAAAEAGRRELKRFLPVLEGALEDREWLEGTFSLADLAYVPHLTLVEEAGFDLAPYPRVSGWVARGRARPAWQQTAAIVFDL